MNIQISRENQFYCLRSQLELPKKPSEVFAFFSDAKNLDLITPPSLKFHVLNPDLIEMKEGTEISYRLKVHGVPISWTSLISVWEPPYRFVDEQIRGPYLYWRHEHRFEELGDKTVARDEVRYKVLCGRIVHPLIVKHDLLKIFSFRHEALLRRFS